MAIRHFPSTWCKSVHLCVSLCVCVSICLCVRVSLCVCSPCWSMSVSVWWVWLMFVTPFCVWRRGILCGVQIKGSWWYIDEHERSDMLWRHWIICMYTIMRSCRDLSHFSFPTLTWLSFPWDILSSLHAYVRVSKVESECGQTRVPADSWALCMRMCVYRKWSRLRVWTDTSASRMCWTGFLRFLFHCFN